MDIYDEPFQQVSMWGDTFKVEGGLNSIASSPMLMVNTSSMESKTEYVPHEPRETSGGDQETTDSKVRKRLAQNREAARKSRLRKKAYVQQLETSRLKLMQLELEIGKARKQLQGMCTGNSLDTSFMGSSETINPGIVAFEIEYGNWVDESHRRNNELRGVFQVNAPEMQLGQAVRNVLDHYADLFRMKADAAKADVLYLISGVWKASAERLFLWIGGSRPSQLLNLIVPQLELLTDEQIAGIKRLCLCSQQAEDALSQGLDKLQQSLVQDMSVDPFSAVNHGIQMAFALGKFEALEGFVIQADHLRQETLIRMSRILSTRQAARGLIALGEYFYRLHTLCSVWTSRPRNSMILSPKISP